MQSKVTNMKLIVEDFDTVESLVVEEAESGKKEVYIEGIFAQANLKNRNGRVYPKAIMEREVNKYITEYVSKHRAVGELNHPTTLNVDPERVCHKIVELKWLNENDVWGKSKLTHTPLGELVRNLVVEDGVVLGVSTRGVGTVKQMNEGNVVQNDFFLRCWDVVSDPSAPSAFVNGLMEGKEWIFENGILVEREIDQLQKEVDKAASKGKFGINFEREIFEKVISKL